MWRAALTEFVATACLMFTLTSSIIACLDSHEVDSKLLVPIAVFIIAFLFLMVTVPLSGGHMSPVFTFIAALKGVTVTFDKNRCKELGLEMVCLVVAGAMALAVFVSITVTGKSGYAGVGLNPARCLGPALLQGGILWDGHWVFWVGSILACSVYYCFSLSLPHEGFIM
ncbi:hypothetical protein ACLB2K_017126 [Fragaria x ananassa]